MNITHVEVKENRERLITFGKMLQVSDKRIMELAERFSHELAFNEIYLSLLNMLDSSKNYLRNIQALAVDLQLQVNFLLNGHINPTIISAVELKQILVVLQVTKL